MPISFQCQCGRKFRTADENAGRSATCPDCRTQFVVPASEAVPVPAAVLPPPLPDEDPPVVEPAAYPVESEEVTPVPRRPGAPPYGRPRRDDDYPRRPLNYGRDDIRDRIVKRPPPARSAGMTGAGILGGIGMMIGAVVWFIVGLQFDTIFFYPPILFIIGLIAFIRGLASSRA